MPGNILSADTQFPNFAGQENPAEQIRTIRNYLYMLLEQLRYTLNNLDAGNFNTEGLKEIQDAISQPILKQLSDTDGNLAELQVTAAGLASRVSSNEGNISQLEQTAQGLSSRVGDAEGNISSLQQTANGLSSRVTSAEGNISTLQQTANGLSSRVSNAEGSISSLSQTASGLETRVANAEGAVSTVSQKVNGVTVTTGYGQTFLAGDRIVMSSDVNNYMTVGSGSIGVFSNGIQKAFIGQTSGADNYSVILGNTNPAVVQKIYNSYSGNQMWVGNENKTCGIMFNFNTGTYQFYGTKVGT